MARRVLKQDWADYTEGDFSLVNNPWNNGRLKNGVDYTQSIVFDDTDITRNVRFRWDWPDAGHVVAYPEIIAGYKPWGKSGTDSLSTRLDKLETLDVSIDYRISGDKTDFNVAFDLWLTKAPASGPASITTELMIWTHDGGLTPAGEKVGMYRDGKFRAEIWVAEEFGDSSGESNATWRYIAIKSESEIRKDTIDIARIIDRLIDRGLIEETDYLNGYEFGAEVIGGRGKLMLNSIGHEFVAAEERDLPAAAAVPEHADELAFL